MDIEHTSLGRRFKDFALEHLSKSYFREEAVGAINPISKFDLAKALTNAYQARSQYIHNLKPLPSLLTHGFDYSESSLINNQPWLTIQGLSRLARHIITNFVKGQPTLDIEDYNYSLERSGIVQLPLAAEYWVGKTDIYHGSGSRKLEGFLEQLSACFSNRKANVTDLKNVLTVVEQSIHELKKEDRLPYIALYLIYNNTVSIDQRTPNAPTFSERYHTELIPPSAESMLVKTLFNITPDWDLSEHHDTLSKYFDTRNNKFKFRAPSIIETGMILNLAERYRVNKELSIVMELISMAVENFPSHGALRKFEQDFKHYSGPIEWYKIMLTEE